MEHALLRVSAAHKTLPGAPTSLQLDLFGGGPWGGVYAGAG